MDNTAFHKRADIQQLFKQTGYVLKYLHTYSPLLNPIEHKWAQAKAIRKHKHDSLEELFQYYNLVIILIILLINILSFLCYIIIISKNYKIKEKPQMQLKYSDKLIMIGCLSLVYLHGLIFYSGSTGTDDVYITYWAAQTLSDWGYITNYNGEAVEQSSSLLHTILLAALHKFSGVPIVTLGIYLSMFMGGMTLLIAWQLARSLKLRYSWFVVLFCALFSHFVYWSFAGLETTLVAFLVTSLVYALIKIFTQKTTHVFLFFTGLLIVAYILVRPETIFIISLFFLQMGVYMLIYNRFNRAYLPPYFPLHYKRLVQLFGVSLTAFILVSIWRYQNFAQIFPQPVYAKSAGLVFSNVLAGIEYLFQQYWVPSLVVLTALVIFGVIQMHRYRVPTFPEQALVIIVFFFLAQMAFVVAKGDDWMEGGRFFVPILPLLVVAGLYTIHQFPMKMASTLLIFLSLTALIDNSKFNKYQSRGTYLPLIQPISDSVTNDFAMIKTDFHWPEKLNREHLAHIPSIITLDKIITRLSSVKSPLIILSGEMGMIPFYIANKHFGKVKFIDMFGLTTRHLSHCGLEEHFKGRFGSHLFRGRFGIQIAPWFFLRNFEDIQKNCPVQYPDIIYGMGDAQWIEELDKQKRTHQLVYKQTKKVTTGGCWSRQEANATYFIVVHKELSAKIGKLYPSTYQWPQITCDMRRSW